MQNMPSDPVARFLAIATTLTAEKAWTADRTVVRYGALPLVTAPGDPKALARRAISIAETLKADSRWGSELRGSMRYVLAGVVVARELSAVAFLDACERIRQRCRAAGVRRGGPYELVASAMLHIGGADSEIGVGRMQRIYETMKAHHWWLTGPDDLPACALLATHGDEPSVMPARIEAIYARLRAAGLSASDGLQLASHVLYLAPGRDLEVADRFLALHRGFLAAGIRMWDSDRDELALLCLVDEDPRRTIDLVVDHRARIREGLHGTGPTTSFSFACGTAFLELLANRPADANRQSDLDVANLAMATNAATVLQNQRAAAHASV